MQYIENAEKNININLTLIEQMRNNNILVIHE